MFCKNCGTTVNESAERCDVCQFKLGFGKNYCQFCGKKLEEGENVCSQCGNETTTSANAASTVNTEAAVKAESSTVTHKNEPADYKKSFMRLNIFSLCVEIISLLLISCLIFLPIYKCKYEAQLEDIEDLEELEEALENDGYLEKNFSAFDDFIIFVGELLAESDSSEAMLQKILILENGLFLLFEIIFAVILICMLIKKIFENISNIRDIDNNCILRYNEIKKSGRQEHKQGFFKKQSIFSIIVYAVFDIIFTKIFSEFLTFGLEYTCGRNMTNFVAPSGFIAVIIVLLIGQIVINHLCKKEENDIKLRIAKEE